MINCPTCGDYYESDRSMRHHHSISHNKRLPNSKCNTCDKEFFSKSGERKYCDECLSFEGENNPNYSAKKKKTNCEICDDEFKYYPTEKSGLFCANCVEEEEWRTTPEVSSGKENHRYNSIAINCSYCGDTNKIPQSEVSNKNYCDMICYSKHRSEFQKGENNPNYKDGEYKKSEFYQGNWERVKRNCKIRDNNTCKVCNSSEKLIDVHHIKPVRLFDEPNNAHTMDNVICLCRSCHMKIDHGNKELPKDLNSSNV